MKKPVITALCCLLSLGTATAAFAEEPTPTPAPELVELLAGRYGVAVLPGQHLVAGKRRAAACRQAVQRTVWHNRCRPDRKHYAVERRRLHLMGRYAVCGGRCDRGEEVTQDFELSVRSADAETARNDVKESVAYDDEYGFSGTLTLQDITIGETLQADSTYMATAHYAGTVTRTEAGTVHYTLLYAPISAPVVVAAAESGITPALLITGIACALLFIAVLLIITHLLRKEPTHTAEPAKPAPAPKVYVPSGDIVLGGRNEDDDEENL